jgi:hypothetical protein
MIPAAAPRAAAGTLVPSLIAATEDRPMPAPPAATHSGSAHGRLAARDERGVTDGDERQPARDETLRRPSSQHL